MTRGPVTMRDDPALIRSTSDSRRAAQKSGTALGRSVEDSARIATSACRGSERQPHSIRFSREPSHHHPWHGVRNGGGGSCMADGLPAMTRAQLPEGGPPPKLLDRVRTAVRLRHYSIRFVTRPRPISCAPASTSTRSARGSGTSRSTRRTCTRKSISPPRPRRSTNARSCRTQEARRPGRTTRTCSCFFGVCSAQLCDIGNPHAHAIPHPEPLAAT